jgi:two-component system LytT family sensor kinase
MSNKNKLYWYCQIIGWLLFFSINSFYAITLDRKEDKLFWLSLSLFVIAGVTITHLMRFVIHRFDIKKSPFKKQIVQLIGITLLFSAIIGFVSESIDILIGYIPKSMLKYSAFERMLLGGINSIGLLLIWNCLYYIYHFIEKNRRQELDTIRLESLVKSLELKTIKSHINPHFIFNSLNSIRALVDENPQRARKAITELSNILRSSMQAEKVETVSFSQELNIVRDYLALEQMRFEERLQLEFDIDPSSHDRPIPPMMLQMLAENAIKHGISKQINGGMVRISSRIINDKHEISVENTGILDESLLQQNNGFGIKSTQDQLNILYQGKAAFSIFNIPDKGTVECKILMPI